MQTFNEWKNKCQADLNRLGRYSYVTGPSGRDECILSARGRELRSVLLACLNIADWSNSATEALKWVNGEYEMHADIKAALSSDLAQPYILALHKVAAIEGVIATAIGRQLVGY